MTNKGLKIIVAIGIAAHASGPCLAGSTESGDEAPFSIVVPGAGMASQISSTIQKSPDLSDNAKQVNVASKDGAIVLTGTVDTQADRDKINSIVENSGAASVRNEIKVKKHHKKKTITTSSTTRTTGSYPNH